MQLGTILGIDIETRAVHRSAMLACLLARALETKRAARSHVSVVPFIRSTISALLDKCSADCRSTKMRHSQPKMEKKKSGKLHLSD